MKLQEDLQKAINVLEKYKDKLPVNTNGCYFDEQSKELIQQELKSSGLQITENMNAVVTIIDPHTWYRTPLVLDTLKTVLRGLHQAEKQLPLVPVIRNNGRQGWAGKYDRVKRFGSLEAVENFVSMSKQNLEQAQEHGTNKLIGAMSKQYEEDCELLKIAENYDFEAETREIEEEKHKAIDYQESLKDGVEIEYRYSETKKYRFIYTRNGSQYEYEHRDQNDAIDMAVRMYRMIHYGTANERINTLTKWIKDATERLIPYCYKKSAVLKVKYGLSYGVRQRAHDIEDRIKEYQKELLFLTAQIEQKQAA